QRRQAARSLCLAHVERLLQQAIDAGQLPRDTDTSLATHSLHAFMSGLMREWVLEKDAYDLAAVAPALVDMTVAGLRNDPPRRANRVRPRVRPRSCTAT
ncbi:MAG TPA: TetR family transcriptional regulator C-terminal domain-containing protein, partial [Casimicrobiaceae bacterium]|nr:TetR family transcriptional regulator C-terminal domain-containing protein [Casimicrobiaceae bacterium]